MAYYTDSDLEPVRQELRAAFSIGNLYSHSPIIDVAHRASQILRDHGMQPRKSLCLMLANEARGWWACEIQAEKIRSA
jgi:hypothetical protein